MSYRGIDSNRRSLVSSLLKTLLLLAILLVIAGIVWGSYRISDELSASRLEVQEFEPAFNVSVREVFTGEIGLDPRFGSQTRLDRPEVAGLQWFGGYGQITGLVDDRADVVVRQFQVLQGERPAVGDQVFVDHLAYRGDPQFALGIPFEEVTVPSPLGSLPAWHIDGPSDTWAIMVHDHGDRGRQEFLRIIPAVRAAGHPILVTTYRNDDDAPKTDGRRHTYGIDEADDLAAAVQFALDRGAEDVVVFGNGAGGAIALSFAYDSPLAASLAGLVLEAPMTDLEEQLYADGEEFDFPGTDIQLPRQLIWLVLRLSEWRWDMDLDETDFVARSRELEVPTLVIRNGADETIDPAQSDALASRNPRMVVLENYETAGHNRAWNVDPDGYEETVLSWLSGLRS